MTTKTIAKKRLKMNLTKTYKEIFNVSISKKDFTEAMLRQFPSLKIKTIERRYYEFKKTPNHRVLVDKNTSSQIFISDDEIQEPNHLQKLLLQDAKRLNIKITKNFLEHHGFRPYEINWLIKRKELKDD